MMHAPPRNQDIPEARAEDLKKYDGFIFGAPTRYGRAVAQVSQFFDSVGFIAVSLHSVLNRCTDRRTLG